MQTHDPKEIFYTGTMEFDMQNQLCKTLALNAEIDSNVVLFSANLSMCVPMQLIVREVK